MKRMLKFSNLLALLCVFGLSSCSKNNLQTGNVDTNYDYEIEVTTENSIYYPESIDRNNAESVAKGFINAIKNKDFTTARSLINLNDGNLISEEDVEYIIRRTLIGFLIGQPDAELYGEGFSESSGAAIYSFYTDSSYNYDKYYTIELLLNNENEWVIDKKIFVKDETYCYVPEGVRLYLDGEEVPTEYKVRTENNTDVYRLLELARREHDTKIVSSIFGEITGSINIPSYNPINSNEEDTPIEVYREITLELFNELGEHVKNMYNDIYKLMDIEASAENLTPYIIPNKSYKFLEENYQNGISARIAYDDSQHSKTNVEILEFWQNPASSSYVYSNDTVVVNMVLSIRWNEGDIVRSEYICSGTKLQKEVGGEWLINDITPSAWIVLQAGLDESQGVNAW